jgi:hypothetical protein
MVSLSTYAGGCEAFCDAIREIDGNCKRFHATNLASHDLVLYHKEAGMEFELKSAARHGYEKL